MNQEQTDLSGFWAGARQQMAGSDRLPLINPANGNEVVELRCAGPQDVDAAVVGARAAFSGPWRSLPPIARAGCLKSLAGLVEENADKIAAADSLDMGKPVGAAHFEVGIAAGFLRYYGEAIDKAAKGHIAPTDSGAFEMQVRRPWGVIGAIIPWNFPIINLCMKIAPMLAMGNCVVVKPSELSPRSALIVADLSADAGFPPSVINVLPGGGAVGDMIVRHGGIDMAAFTGSTATGKKLMAAIGQSTLKPVLLECGGKSPEVVFGDMAGADLDKIAGQILRGAMMNQGQVCVARSRLYVEDVLYEPLKAKLLEQAHGLKPSDPSDPTCIFGPLASARQQAIVEGFIEKANAADILLDGRRCEKPSQGCYVGPTLIEIADQSSPIVQEEIFGPVLALHRFDGEQDAIALANGTDFGLAATVWTRDIGRAHRMSEAIDAGMVKIMAAPVERMGAGYAHSAEASKQSGFGIEGGLNALNSFSRLQAVEMHFEDSAA